MRDIKELERQGMKIIRQHECADLSVNEVMHLVHELKSDNDTGVIDIIYSSFLMGVAIGARNGK